MKFAEIAAATESEILVGQHEKEIELARSKFERAQTHLREKQKEHEDYKGETLKVIRGQSKLSIDLLNSLVADTEALISEAQTELEATEREYAGLLESAESLRHEYDRLLSWADLYNSSTFEARKMIVSQFIKAVRVGRDYNIEIDFNVLFEEFQSSRVNNSKSESMQTSESRTA